MINQVTLSIRDENEDPTLREGGNSMRICQTGVLQLEYGITVEYSQISTWII